MTFNISSSNFDNDDFELDEDSSGDLVLTHKDSGATFKYDSSESVWIPSGGLGSANNPVSSIHSDSVNADEIDTGTILAVYEESGETHTEKHTSVQSAVNSIPTTGGVVKLGGDVTISSGLTHPGDRYVGLEGPGKNAVAKITADANVTGPMYSVATAGFEWWGHIERVYFDAASNASKCLDINASPSGHIRQCVFRNATAQNVHVHGQQSFTNTFEQVTSWGAGTHCYEVNAGNAIEFISCRAVGAGGHGWLIDGPFESAPRILGGTSESHTGDGVRIENNSPVRNAIIRDIHIENTDYGIRHAPTDGGSRTFGLWISGCMVTDTVTNDAIDIQTDHRGTVIGPANRVEKSIVISGSGSGSAVFFNWYDGTATLTDSTLASNVIVLEPRQGTFDMGDATPRQVIRSSPPSNPETGDYYIDDGSTNTASGNLAIRVYDGTEWVDQN